MTTVYATVWDSRDDNKAASTADNLYLFKSLKAVSKRIDQLMSNPRHPRPFFGPWLETRKVLVTTGNVDSIMGTLDIGGPLLALTSVAAGTTALVVGTGVELWPDSSMSPWSTLRLISDCGGCWPDWYRADAAACNGCTPLQVSIAGTWGFNSDYANALVKVDTLRVAITDLTTTTFAVNTVDGAGLDGNTPTFSVGNLISIDGELGNITATNNTVGARTVTVQARGANGSTAATHLIGADIKVWQVESDIKQVVARQAAFINARRGAYTTVVVDGAGGEVRYPPDLLPELRATLAGYAYAL